MCLMAPRYVEYLNMYVEMWKKKHQNNLYLNKIFRKKNTKKNKKKNKRDLTMFASNK